MSRQFTEKANKRQFIKIVAMGEPGGKRNLVRNIKAQYIILNKPIIIET